jgi:excisionase family DNA binding protein
MNTELADDADGPLLYSIKRAALRLGISVGKVYQLLGTGEVRSVKIGRRRLIPRDALEEYVADLNVRFMKDAR